MKYQEIAFLGREMFMDCTSRVHGTKISQRLINESEFTEEFRRAFLISRNRFFRDHVNKMERSFERIKSERSELPI